MPSQLVAGVDSSTQSCKIVVCDAETGQVLREGRATHPEGTEVSAQAWWDAFLAASADGLLDGVSALAVGGQQHGMVTLDEDDRLVRDALLWNDTRSAAAAAELVEEFGGAQAWVDAVGLVPVASFTVTKLRWLAQHEPQNAARVARVVLPHDWLTGKLLAERGELGEWTTDRGDASGTGYWSPASGHYRSDLVELAFGRSVAVPRVAEPHEVVGQLSDGTLVAPGSGDNMAAALGLGLRQGDVVVSLGTSGAVFTEHDRPIADPTGIVAGFASATGGHLPLACTLNAARVLVAGAASLGTDVHGLDSLAMQAPPGAEGLTLLPYLDGERTPNLPEATGTLSGLTRSNLSPQNIARAYVEGMLANLAECVDGLRELGVRVDRILLIGGASAAQSVRDVASRLFGAPVAVPAAGEYVALGAARQAAWALHGGGAPPAWRASYDVELDPIDDAATADLRARYAVLRGSLYPRTVGAASQQ